MVLSLCSCRNGFHIFFLDNSSDWDVPTTVRNELMIWQNHDTKLHGAHMKIAFLRGIVYFYSIWFKMFLENFIRSHYAKFMSKYILGSKINLQISDGVQLEEQCHNELKPPEYQHWLTNVQIHITQEVNFNDKPVDQKPEFFSHSTQTLDDPQENVTVLMQQLVEKDKLIDKFKEQIERFFEEKQSLEIERRKWKAKYEKIINDYEDILIEFGRLSVEYDSNKYKVKETENFQKLFPLKSPASLVVNTSHNESPSSTPKSTINFDILPHSHAQPKVDSNSWPLLTMPSQLREQAVSTGVQVPMMNTLPKDQYQSNIDPNSWSVTNENNVSLENMPFSVQVEERSNFETVSLANKPSCSIALQVYNAYKLLLLTISNWLLSSDIIKIKEWANEKFAVERNLSLTVMFYQLDQKGAINALNLGQLRAFFVCIGRYDLVYLIEEFSAGDYDKLKRLISQLDGRKNSHETAKTGSEIQGASSRVNVPQSSTSSWATTVGQAANNVERRERLTRNDETHEIPIARNNRRLTNIGSNLPSTSNSNAADDRSPASANPATVSDASIIHNTRGW